MRYIGSFVTQELYIYSITIGDSVIFRPGFFGLDVFIYFNIINVYMYTFKLIDILLS